MRRTTKAVVIFSIVLLLLGALYFVVMYAITRERLVGVTEEPPVVVHATESELPLDPRAPFWDRVEPMTIHLWPQNARVPYGKEERDVRVRSAYNDRHIAFLLEFADATEDRDAAKIPDACAVFLGPADSPPAAQMMGQDASGNIWQWLADRDKAEHMEGSDSVQAVRELITAGPGTQSPADSQTVAGRGEYGDGRWRVVFKRALVDAQEGGLALEPGGSYVVSFAVWDGAKMEAFASKSISILTSLILEPRSPQ